MKRCLLLGFRPREVWQLSRREKRFTELCELSSWLRPRLREAGFELIGEDSTVSPAVTTIALPAEMKSTAVGAAIQESGYLVSYNSEYLRRRNWIQICLMGDTAKEKLVSLLNALNRVCFRRRGGAMVEAPAQEVQSKASSAQS